MRTGIWTCAAFAAALGLSAVTQAQTPGAPRGVIEPAPGPDDAHIAKRPQGIDAEFVDKAGLAGKSEMQASQLALEKAASPDVRAFAKRMIDDHGRVAARLRGLGVRKGVPVQTVQIVDPDVEALRRRSGRDFDVAYLAVAGPDAHRRAIRVFEDEARNGHDPDLRAFANDTLPLLRKHLAAAQALARKLGAQ
ncbi:DUF4142 domain-containing protein [Burkholderia sp. 4701]|nr:DUF4142 domain-containing protein [Burkholderia sp. 4701]MXN85440.1 DUF4142 domain-containing protein [Burkholderia sp. 4812]